MGYEKFPDVELNTETDEKFWVGVWHIAHERLSKNLGKPTLSPQTRAPGETYTLKKKEDVFGFYCLSGPTHIVNYPGIDVIPAKTLVLQSDSSRELQYRVPGASNQVVCEWWAPLNTARPQPAQQ